MLKPNLSSENEEKIHSDLSKKVEFFEIDSPCQNWVIWKKVILKSDQDQ